MVSDEELNRLKEEFFRFHARIEQRHSNQE